MEENRTSENDWQPVGVFWANVAATAWFVADYFNSAFGAIRWLDPVYLMALIVPPVSLLIVFICFRRWYAALAYLAAVSVAIGLASLGYSLLINIGRGVAAML